MTKKFTTALVLATTVALGGTGLAAMEAIGMTTAPATDRLNVSFTASNGLTSAYHVYAAGVPQPAGLLIWTHGDGAWEFDHPNDPYVMGGPNGVRALAKAQGYIVVSALAPDRRGTITWWENGARNADYMADLIRHLQGEYRIDSNDIVLAGYSGGAQFTTQYFLPEYSSMLSGGGSIVFGGGGAPETPDQRSWNPYLPQRFFMHWATGALDDAEHSDEDYDAIGYAREGLAYYDDLGYSTSHEWIPGKDHVIDGMFGGIVAQQLQAHPAQGWPVGIRVEKRYGYLTVTIPAGTTGTTTVRAYGSGGSYWYQSLSGTGDKTFRMGDPGDLLTAGTTYRFTVTQGGVERASGSFTTRR